MKFTKDLDKLLDNIMEEFGIPREEIFVITKTAMGTVLLFLSPCTHHAVWRGTVRRPSGKTWKGCADELIKRDIQASAVTQLSYTENEHDRRNIQLCKKEIRS